MICEREVGRWWSAGASGPAALRRFHDNGS